MNKFVLYAASALAIGLPALPTPPHGTSSGPATTSTIQAWMPIWAFRAAVDAPAAGIEPAAGTAA
ncbi:hypothetical protein GCM10010519_73920 [Streptomyces lactacystinicus]